MEHELVERASYTFGETEMILWNDGSLTIQHWMAPFEPENPAYGYIHIPLEQRVLMYNALYGPLLLSPTTFDAAA